MLNLVQCERPGEDCAPLQPVGLEVCRERIAAARLVNLVPLSRGHAPEAVLSDFPFIVHAVKHTASDARWYAANMTEGNLALPIELLGSLERYAVYRCYSDDGQLLYVGETGDLGTRLASHAQKLWFVQVRGITLEWYSTELEALAVEQRAIHVEHPKYNKQHRQATSAQVARRKSGKRAKKTPALRIDPAVARKQAEEIYLSNPRISGKDLGAKVGLGERWGQLRRAEFAKAVAGTGRSDERS